jgi:hypothetical protein
MPLPPEISNVEIQGRYDLNNRGGKLKRLANLQQLFSVIAALESAATSVAGVLVLGAHSLPNREPLLISTIPIVIIANQDRLSRHANFMCRTCRVTSEPSGRGENQCRSDHRLALTRMSLHRIAEGCKGYEVARLGHYSCTQVALHSNRPALPHSRRNLHQAALVEALLKSN